MAKRYPRVEEYARLEKKYRETGDREAYNRLEELRKDFTQEEWRAMKETG